ncbi:lycopene cyclase domain-containing protein [Candidatus Saccharibacteria bacterium]|nr:lycopene cyclase domain-containing protein [Candidatus Saccharibacteria bacterium]
MYNYSILALSLIAITILILIRFRIQLPYYKVLLAVFAILLTAMLIFDTYLTSLPIVLYNTSSLLGIKVGSIPLEDFSYLVAVVLLIPALFEYFIKRNHDKKN